MAKKEKLMVIPLGGLGEIGKNMTVIQYGNDIIVIDAGLSFPDDDMFGIDLVIPDMSYLIENRDKVRAVVITHGHEDHIGSLAYLLNEVNVPVYATKLVCGLIEGKLKENHITNYKLNEVQHGDEVQIGCMKVGFIRTNHSIPDASALYFKTPVGTIVHTGDFKIDLTPVDGQPMDIHKFADWPPRRTAAYVGQHERRTAGLHRIGNDRRPRLPQGLPGCDRTYYFGDLRFEYFPYSAGDQYGRAV